MFAIIRTRWQTRPLSRRAKRRSSAAPGSPRKKYAGILHPPNMVRLLINSTTSGDHRKPVLIICVFWPLDRRIWTVSTLCARPLRTDLAAVGAGDVRHQRGDDAGGYSNDRVRTTPHRVINRNDASHTRSQ